MITRLLSLAGTVAGRLAASAAFRAVSQTAKAALLIFPASAVTSSAGLQLGPSGCVAVMIVCALLGAAGRWAEQVCGHSAAFELLAGMRVRLYDALTARGSAPGGAAGGRLLGVATRDINRVEVFFAHTLAPTVVAGVVTVAGLVWLTVWADAGAGAWIVLLACLAAAWLLPLLRRTGRETEIRGRIDQHLSEDTRGRLEIASLGAGPARLAGLDRLEDELAADVTATGALTGARRALADVWPWAGAVAMFAATGSVAAAVTIVAFSPVFAALEGFARDLPSAMAAARRYFAELDHPVVVPEPAEPGRLPDGPLSVRFESVTVTRAGRTVLDGVDFAVPAGGRVGIVGPSGSGKSTLAEALVRLLDVDGGCVRVGGVDVRDVHTHHLRAAVGLVEQSPTVLRGSVLDNLRLGAPELDEQAAREALALADAAELDLEANAAGLSGGQRQRLALARVLARKPRVLILDEATSHQDALGQKELTDMLAGLSGVTVIVIAHRRAALAGVDAVREIAPAGA